MVDARLKDGSRVNAIIPPLSIDGPSMSIRRFGSQPRFVGTTTSTTSRAQREMIEFFQAVRAWPV